jgi:hypothetical protein
MVVSLGPKSTIVRNVPANPRPDGLGSNPRCLRRDVNKHSAAGARANYTYSTIMDNKDIDSFYNRYLGQPQLKGDTHPWGVRAGFSSPCPPLCQPRIHGIQSKRLTCSACLDSQRRPLHHWRRPGRRKPSSPPAYPLLLLVTHFPARPPYHFSPSS